MEIIMVIDISDLENFVHTHNPVVRANDQGHELVVSSKGANYQISHVIDTESDVAFVHLAKSFYFPHGRISVLEPYNDGYQPLIPVTIKLPADVSRVVVGEDYYLCEGMFVSEGCPIYFIDGYDTENKRRTLLLPPHDLVRIANVIDKIPDQKLPVTSLPVKSGTIIFREFPTPWPRERLTIEEIEFNDERGQTMYVNLRNQSLKVEKF